MNFNLSANERKKLLKLFEQKEHNVIASEIVLALIDEFENHDLCEEFVSIASREAYENKLKELYDFDPSDAFQTRVFKNQILDSIIPFNREKYINNPFYQKIKESYFKDKTLELTTKRYQKNQLFIIDEVESHGDYYREKLALSYPKNDFDYLALIENNKIWMAIIPHEINTMERSIEAASGRALVLGLGLGYYPFMISLKPTVSQIVIVEKNKKIIDIFKQKLLPLFPQKDKIEIVEADAYRYLKDKHESFDFAFFDIYRTTDDGLRLYLKAKKQERLYTHLKIHYWLEKSLLAHLRRILIMLIEEEYFQYEVNEKSPLDDIVSQFAKKLKDTTFNSFEEIRRQLEDDAIKQLLK